MRFTLKYELQREQLFNCLRPLDNLLFALPFILALPLVCPLVPLPSGYVTRLMMPLSSSPQKGGLLNLGLGGKKKPDTVLRTSLFKKLGENGVGHFGAEHQAPLSALLP